MSRSCSHLSAIEWFEDSSPESMVYVFFCTLLDDANDVLRGYATYEPGIRIEPDGLHRVLRYPTPSMPTASQDTYPDDDEIPF